MKNLSPNWITEKHIDFEYKKYVLLAYLQEVEKNFGQTFLYPCLSDLVGHYRKLIQLKENKKEIFERFPERLIGTDSERFQLMFKKIVSNDSIMEELESIIEYSIPEFEKSLTEGQKIYEFIEEHINITPVGVLPLHRDEGYFIFHNGPSKECRVYEYQVTIFENPNEKFRGIYTNHIATYEHNLSNTSVTIKQDLIRYYNKLVNPATFDIESDLEFPFVESLMPVAKRTFVKYLSETQMS